MKRFWVFGMAGFLSFGATLAAEAAGYHCSEERENPAPKTSRKLFVVVDEEADLCTVGEQGIGFLPARVIGQPECSSGEVQVQVDESAPRRADDGKIEYRANVRLRWDDQASRPVYQNYIFYCRRS